MHYEGHIIRPPSEANSILLQVTVGCSHNHCTFCGTYKCERFRIKEDAVIMQDIAFAASYCKRQRRVFLCDGDAMIIPQKRLLNILLEIKKQVPWVTRVGVYSNTKSLKMKTPDELSELKAHGLGIAYMGLETGDDVTLKQIGKGASAETMIQMGKKTKAAGIKLSITVILGIAGMRRSTIHAQETGRPRAESPDDEGQGDQLGSLLAVKDEEQGGNDQDEHRENPVLASEEGHRPLANRLPDLHHLLVPGILPVDPARLP